MDIGGLANRRKFAIEKAINQSVNNLHWKNSIVLLSFRHSVDSVWIHADLSSCILFASALAWTAIILNLLSSAKFSHLHNRSIDRFGIYFAVIEDFPIAFHRIKESSSAKRCSARFCHNRFERVKPSRSSFSLRDWRMNFLSVGSYFHLELHYYLRESQGVAFLLQRKED